MGVSDVMSRIAQLQGQLSVRRTPAASGAQFAATLQGAMSGTHHPQKVIPRSTAMAARPVSLTAATSLSGAVSGIPYADLFNAAGAKHGVSPRLLAAVAKVESNYDPRAVSHAGAQGLMQIMPATARGVGVNAFDPAQAVDGAARILKANLKEFGSLDLALAAYNAGGGAVKKHRGIPPFAETQAYVPKVKAALAALGG